MDANQARHRGLRLLRAIIGGPYGSLGPEGKSYTEMEYEYEISNKKPVIAFLHGDSVK